ncbi:MAG: hypothetical protein K0R29_2113 [Pseudobdellovibrio sp.]|jgi:hypothetical protein|nr:hypothetical protein [Pseudobdellovibrio sp.]
MSGLKKKTPAEELIESLLQDVGDDSENASSETPSEEEGFAIDSGDGEKTEIDTGEELDEATIQAFLNPDNKKTAITTIAQADKTNNFDATNLKTTLAVVDDKTQKIGEKTAALKLDETELPNIPSVIGGLTAKNLNDNPEDLFPVSDSMVTKRIESKTNAGGGFKLEIPSRPEDNFGDGEKTVAVAGYQRNNDEDYGDRVKVSVGQNRPATSGYAVWGSSGSAESNLAQADNLRIAQEKILELESENEKLRLQNEELMSASEIIKERSDLLSAQLSEYKNDRDNLEESFKNEIVLLKNHLSKKDGELQKASMKSDELESRLKFDMKKIRVRERELENRLELIRAEKNAIVKNKDEQILDLRRKMDVLQMEVESYRQKCVELNKLIETNQESFKRTTRALRLAMANLELQEENKVPMKKAE